MSTDRLHRIINEEDIDEFGKRYLDKKDYCAAIAIYKFKNIVYGETEPNLTKLAEAYEISGNKLKALEIYQYACRTYNTNNRLAAKIENLKTQLN